MIQTYSCQEQSRGVALVVALFVLAIISTILVVVLADVQSELKMSGVDQNSERALKIAEACVNIARANFSVGGTAENLTTTQELASVDAFIQGGYCFTHLGSGFPGYEKWVQWHYNAAITGNNDQSEITTPLRRVWATGSIGRNGTWRSGNNFYVNNIYAIVAGGAYFPIEKETDTLLRAHDEYTGRQEVINKGVNDGIDPYWEGDKTIGNTTYGDYVVRMSPMASFSNLSTTDDNVIAITEQTLYFTYVGDDSGTANTSNDNVSTVRLRAADALSNPVAQTELSTLWEFDTGIHGIGTAPAFFDPSPDEPGDEIIYFAVVGFPKKNTSGSQFMVDLRSDFKEYPAHFRYGDEQIYLFALVDTSRNSAISAPFIVKWVRPFPDPDVMDWTDYPTEQATGTKGFYPPYVRVPSDMTPFLPEDDVLFDYRDGIANNGTDDNQRNQVRGNVYMVFDPQSLSPPVLKVLYRLYDCPSGLFDTECVEAGLTTKRIDTFPKKTGDPMKGDPADPLIDIYLAFSAHSRSIADSNTPYWETINWGNGILGNKKESVVQTRIIALRDRLDGSCDTAGDTIGKNCTWNWNSAKSRFPTYKWSYRLPAFDPKQDDQRPWNGYGEFTWETWFEQQIAPMLADTDINQDGTTWLNTTDQACGKENLYTVIYPSYESLGFLSGSANNNTLAPPTIANGAPVSFPNSDYDDRWDISRIMIMGIRDTWQDYMRGERTNCLFSNMTSQANPYAIVVKSSPAEPYWTHQHDGVICGTDGTDIHTTYPDSTETLITYPQYTTNINKVGFPRPYIWSEGMFENITGSKRNFTAQGWKGVGGTYDSNDADVEGETSAFCRECLDGDGLIVTVFNHDMTSNREDLRVHAVNATTGVHTWDYHMPAMLAGDYFNATPAIANNLVFVAYQNFAGRQSILQVINADSGTGRQRLVFDRDSDVVVLPPTVANGAVYVGSYDFNDGTDNNSMDDDVIRIFAYSPMLRMYSVGIYPKSTSLSLTDTEFSNMPRAERKLQVWITGDESKWEEIRGVYEP